MSEIKRSRAKALGLLVIVAFPGLFIALFFFAEQHFSNLPFYGPFEVVTTTQNGETVTDTVYQRVIDFSFEMAQGGTVTDEDMLGKVYVAEFFHGESRIRLLHDKFEGEPDIKFLSHTVDSVDNNADYLSAYSELIKANPEQWIFATAPVEELLSVAFNGYFAEMATEQEIHDMLINHNVFVLVDKEGLVRGIYDGGASDQALISEIKRVEEEIRLLKKYYDKATVQ